MLAEIRASPVVLGDSIDDPSDPRLLSAERVHLIVRGNTQAALYARLERAFRKRFRNVPSDQLRRDLVYPLKKGLGNAYKRGNREDPTKHITVDAVLTGEGALVAVSDEGDGFDVEATYRRFREGEHYFTHGGGGLAGLEKSRSVVSYDRGGRTLLIRFLCTPEPGGASTHAERAALGPAGDESFMRAALARLPRFRGKREVLSCRVYLPTKRTIAGKEIRYVVEYRRRRSDAPRKEVLSGRLLVPAEAWLDFSVTKQLHEGAFKGMAAIRIPRPLGLIEGERCLVLCHLDSSTDLREYLKKVSSSRTALRVVRAVAEGLQTLHRSRIAVEIAETPADGLARHRAVKDEIVHRLIGMSPERADQVERLFRRIEERAARLSADYELVPSHCAFGWHSIVRDKRHLYMYRFEATRRAHPGFDLGGFLADLLRFYVSRKKGDTDFFETARKAFLDTYFDDASRAWRADLPFFVACALLVRMRAPLERLSLGKIDGLLNLLEQWQALL